MSSGHVEVEVKMSCTTVPVPVHVVYVLYIACMNMWPHRFSTEPEAHEIFLTAGTEHMTYIHATYKYNLIHTNCSFIQQREQSQNM